MRHVLNAFGCCIASALIITAYAAPAAAAERPSYVAGHVALEIGNDRQFVSSLEGGTPVAVITAAPAGSGRVDKRVSGVRYEDIVATFPATSVPAAIRDALEAKTRLSGNIDYTDFDYKSQRRVAFEDAAVTAVRFPAFDAASKDVALVRVVLSPSVTKESPGGGEVKSLGAAGTKQKRALANAFRVQLNGTDVPRVNGVSGLEIRVKGFESATAGAERIPTKQPGEYEIPNFKLVVPTSEAKTWHDWLTKTLDSLDRAEEKTMRIEILDANLKDVMLALDLSGVGIVAVRPKAAEAGSESIARTEIELYAEALKISAGGTPAPAQQKAAADAPAPTAVPADGTTPPPVRRPRVR